MSKKNWLVVKLIVLVLTLIVICGIAVTLIFGYSISLSSLGFKSNLEGGTPTEQEQTFEGIEKIVFYGHSIPLAIVEEQRDDVLLIDNTKIVGMFANRIDENKYLVSENTLYFEQGYPKWLSFGINFNYEVTGEVIIEVPEGVELVYEISSVTGGINIDAPSSELLKIENVNGDIKIKQGGDNLKIESVNGDIDIGSSFNTQLIKSINSDIETVADVYCDEIDIDYVNGDVTVALFEGVVYSVTHDAVSGDIRDSYTGGNDAEPSGVTLEIEINGVSGSAAIVDN